MKSTHNNFKKLTYSPDMDSSARSKADRRKAKKFKNDHTKKKFKHFIPEQRLWLYADSQEKLDRMIFKLRDPILLHNNLDSI